MSLTSYTNFSLVPAAIAGFLIGFALKRIMKILAVIAGVFFAALLYLESQHIMNVNWDKLQTISNGVLSAIATTATSNERYIPRAIERYFGSNSSKNIDNKVAAVGDDSPLSKPDIPFDVALPTTIYL